MSPEVLIYIQNIKKYLEKDDQAREYFLKNVDENIFYEHLSEISQKNFDKNGEAMLSIEQFEEIKKTILGVKKYEKVKEDQKIFYNVNGFGDICLN